MNIKIIFGKAIKEYRTEKGVSQEKLAEICGLHRTYISEVERGVRNVSLINIQKICDALDIKISTVFKHIHL